MNELRMCESMGNLGGRGVKWQYLRRAISAGITPHTSSGVGFRGGDALSDPVVSMQNYPCICMALSVWDMLHYAQAYSENSKENATFVCAQLALPVVVFVLDSRSTFDLRTIRFFGLCFCVAHKRNRWLFQIGSGFSATKFSVCERGRGGRHGYFRFLTFISG